jgi:hypothetical protein
MHEGLDSKVNTDAKKGTKWLICHSKFVIILLSILLYTIALLRWMHL